jgi:hypothetical protein
VRRSLVNDPAVIAAQGEDVTAIYSQLDVLLQNPNTVVFPANSGIGGIASNFITEYWLKSAFDRYVLEGADLLTELQDAEVITRAYLDCLATYEPDPSVSFDTEFGDFESIMTCSNAVDPDLDFGIN